MSQDLLQSAAMPLAALYGSAAAANVGAACRAWQSGRSGASPTTWLTFAGVFVLLGALSFSGRPPQMPEPIKDAIDYMLGPVTFTLGSLAALVVLFAARRFFVKTWVAWSLFNASLVLLGLSLTDPEFANVAVRPDNVPIVAMVYLLGFFVWLAAAQAVENDERRKRGQGPVEAEYSAVKSLVWPDLVYIELIAMILVSAGLIVWSLAIPAPLEQPANPVVTPNPSKAPWYFVGLQEMLVYFDPAIAGVILPCLIILGLAAIPYLDFNPKGSGYYTIEERPFAYVTFLFGFLQLWVLLILIGTFFRGPNWDFYGPYEPRDAHAVLQSSGELQKLSGTFWPAVGRDVPQPPAGSGVLVEMGCLLWREAPGIAVLALYFLVVPLALARTAMREYRRQMGRTRYWIMVLLLLMMLALPLKMLLRWTTGLSYLVSLPEYFLSF